MKRTPIPDDSLQSWTRLIAIHVRNKMEDFHCEHLSDAQMKELNPLIRQGIYEFLRQIFLLGNGTEEEKCASLEFLNSCANLIPDYWEDCVIEEEDLELEKKLGSGKKLTELSLLQSDKAQQVLEDFVTKHRFHLMGNLKP